MKILGSVLGCCFLLSGLVCGQDDHEENVAIYTVEILPNKDEEGSVVKLGEKETIAFVDKVRSRFGPFAYTMMDVRASADGQFSVTITGGSDRFKSYVLKSLNTSGNIGVYGLHPRGMNTKFAEKVFKGEQKAPGYKAYIEDIDEGDGKVYHHYYLLKGKPAVSNVDLDKVIVNSEQPRALGITLNNKGELKMMAFTKNLKKGNAIATVIDDKLVSVAILRAPYLGKDFRWLNSSNLVDNAALAGALMVPFEYQLRVTEVKK